jgi:hypothetical protein
MTAFFLLLFITFIGKIGYVENFSVLRLALTIILVAAVYESSDGCW